MNTKTELEELKIASYCENSDARIYADACGTNAPRESLDTFTALERATDALWDVYMTADEVPE